jgi:UV DNA damage endonuclease
MIRLGLCCIFRGEPIKFRRTTATHLRTRPRPEQLRLLAQIALHNAAALQAALTYCRDHGIGAFRINSQILPLKTHPQAGYHIDQLPDAPRIVAAFRHCGRFSRRYDIRTSFHPDQFVVLNSPDPGVVERSVAELHYQAEVARWVNADVITLHAGGAYADKPAALHRLSRTIRRLPRAVRSRLTLENDDVRFTPQDLAPICRSLNVPLVYDVHHHRCMPDGLSIEAATELALETWSREPLFHISSPLTRDGASCRPHAEYIEATDFPSSWQALKVTVDVEAKAKELAVHRLAGQLGFLS